MSEIVDILKKHVGDYVLIGGYMGTIFASGTLIDADKDIVIVKPDGADVEEYISPSLIKRVRIIPNKVLEKNEVLVW